MEKQKIPREIVESARIMGQWLNRMAYFVAEDNVTKESEKSLSVADKAKKIRQVKSKILTEIESSVMSAKTPQEMFSSANTRAVRLSNGEAPAQAQIFMDEAIVGEHLTLKDAKHLLTAYLRLQQKSGKTDMSTNVSETKTETIDTDENSDNQIDIDALSSN